MKLMFSATLLLFSFALSMQLKGQASTIMFDVFYKDDLIGTVKAVHLVKGDVTVKDIQTKTDTKLMVATIHVESEINLNYQNNILTKGIAYRKASRGNEDVFSTTTATGNKSYTVTKDNVTTKLTNTEIKFCIGDLYFTEPKTIKKVYSNMYAKFLDINSLGSGKYKINLPDGKTFLVHYISGKLETIEVEMSLGKIITKRKK